MKSALRLLLLSVIAVTVLSSNLLVLARQDDVELAIIELKYDESSKQVSAISIDNGLSNPDYKLLGYHWGSTINLYINPSNTYGFSSSSVVDKITTSTATWDSETAYKVFAVKGTTSLSAGASDGNNIVSWGNYKDGVIAVTFIWYNRFTRHIVETDCIMNTRYLWSLSGEENKMDVQNIMTHEFGHWCGLADLYKSRDYWLTMYGYSNVGVTYQQTLGKGDILGLQKVYGL